MPLEFLISSTTNRSYGGGPASFVGSLLDAENADFGAGIDLIELDLHHPGRVSKRCVLEAARKTGMPAVFHEFDPLVGDLSVRFEKKKKRLKITFIAKHTEPDQAFGCFRNEITRDLFFLGFDDVILAMEWGLQKRVRKSDGFDVHACLDWLRSMRQIEFPSDVALRTALQKARSVYEARQAVKDPWDQLDLDWDAFHPDARFLLDDPGDWSNTDDFSPHGNDTGADIFAEWADYDRVEISEAARIFGIPPYEDDQPDYLWKTWVELHLALAFGHIKMSGTCPSEIAEATRDVLAQEFALNKKRRDWAHAQDWSKRLARDDQILFGFDLR